MIPKFLPPNTLTTKRIAIVRLLLHGGLLFLLGYWYWQALNDAIGGDPVETLLHRYGVTALQLVLASLCVTPLVRYIRQPALMRLRRPLGLWAAAFACAHIWVYLAYELQWDWQLVFSELAKRPYIWVGFAAWLILMILAVTSIPKLVRRLGRRWKTLHNTVYMAAILICVHFLWSVKADLTEPALYSALLAVLLFLRAEKLRRYLTPKK